MRIVASLNAAARTVRGGLRLLLAEGAERKPGKPLVGARARVSRFTVPYEIDGDARGVLGGGEPEFVSVLCCVGTVAA